jgi:hypothetical protein
MAAKAKIQQQGNRVQISLELTLEPGTSMIDYEEQILQGLNEVGTLATGKCLEQFDTDGASIVLGGIKLTTKGPEPKAYQTPYGEASVSRHVYQSSQGGQTFCPLEQRARVVNSSTPRFAKMCGFKYAASNSVLAQRDLEENHGRKVSRCYLQDIAQDVATIAEAKEARWQYADPELPTEVSTVAVGLDATCMLYCEEGWRQAMVGTISLYDAGGERLHTVYLGAPPEYGKEDFYQQMDREIRRYKERYHGTYWLGVADGAHDQWTWLAERTDEQILDYWHAAGYLEKAAQGVCSRGKRDQWFDQGRLRLKEHSGGAKKLLKEMRQAREHRQPKGEAAKGLDSAISYFENHLPKMDYAQYRLMGWPIGSGVTEAACKTVIKQRLCGSGMKWKHAGASTVIRLRCLILTESRWQQFWSKIARFGIE